MDCTIDRIEVQDFRGIRRLCLPIEGRNLIVVGENGSGKSSIVDAIEYFFAGRIQPLEGRADIKKPQCIPNLRGRSPEVTVTLKGISRKKPISVSYPKRSAGIPRTLCPFFERAGSQTFVLRRHQVLEFINARDAERYQRISQLVGLGALDTIDKRWRKTRRKAERKLTNQKGKYERILDRLSELLNQPVASERGLIRAISDRLADQGLEPIQQEETLWLRLDTLRRSTRSQANTREMEKLHRFHGNITRTAEVLEELQKETRKLDEAFRAFWEQSAALEDAQLEVLLTEGYRVLQAHADLSNCPLCDAPIPDYVALLRRVSDRVARLRKLTESRRRVRGQKTVVERALVCLHDVISQFPQRLMAHDLPSYIPAAEAVLEWVEGFRRTLGRLDASSETRALWQRPPSLAEFGNLLPDLAFEISERMQQMATGESDKKQVDLLLTMTRVDEHWQRLRAVRHVLRKVRFVYQQIDLVYTELVEARKRGLRRLRAELEKDFERFYQLLHPDEGYGAIMIPVQKEKRSSVALRTRYQDGAPAHPLNYFSEGHMDSLGLCIFLAFIKRFSKDLKLIVLDDVLTTIDAGHRLRVARLLAQEFSDYQLVITTHDRLWAKELDRVLANSRLVPLKKWSLERGADCWEHPLSDWRYYEEQARKGRAQDAIAGAGRNLEKFLDRMRLNLALAVPAKYDNAYTIGDLYPVFWKWVNDHPVERPDRPHFVDELRSLQRELDEVWALRNWSGAHFNEWAATVTGEEALAFLSSVKRLVTAFECPVCGSLVSYKHSIRALTCPGCCPSPPPRVAFRYRIDWYERALNLMGSGKAHIKKNTAPMVQGDLAHFLHDARHRLGIQPPAAPYDEYDMASLYEPFFRWAIAHPRAGVEAWKVTLTQAKDTLDAYWQGAQWQDVPDTETERFVDAVHQVTSLFECADCGQLLNYDQEEGRYFCAACTQQEEVPSAVSACWFVK